MSLPELAAHVGTRLDLASPARSKGLSAAEVAERLRTYGPNVLSPPRRRPLYVQYLLKARTCSGAVHRRAAGWPHVWAHARRRPAPA